MDYEKLGFKCGIEIHQQLETDKLFCNCPSLVNDPSKPDITVLRKLRAVAGETGKIDSAALHEKKKGKEIIYEACSTSSCLVELDEQPPYPVNSQALDAALMVSKLLNATIAHEIQFMRKTVVDGSNTTGFQRTALVGSDGHINTSLGKVRITNICLEEEAAKKIKEEEESITYRLDRLGVPLIEIGTEPDIKNPEHAKETASVLGMILRSTGLVKRGLGSIRQDVNISITGSKRTEIKGFQDIRTIKKVIEYEVKRQEGLIKKGEKINPEVRKAESNFKTSFLRPMPGSARMYPETDVKPITVTDSMLNNIELPELISEKEEKLEKKYKLKPELAKELIYNDSFESYVKKYKKVEPNLIAHILINVPKEIKSRLKLDSSKITESDFEEIFKHLNSAKINKGAVIDLLAKVCNGEKMDVSSIKTVSVKDLESEIETMVKDKPGLSHGAYMGMVMAKHKGAVDGKTVMGILKKFVK